MNLTPPDIRAAIVAAKKDTERRIHDIGQKKSNAMAHTAQMARNNRAIQYLAFADAHDRHRDNFLAFWSLAVTASKGVLGSDQDIWDTVIEWWDRRDKSESEQADAAVQFGEMVYRIVVLDHADREEIESGDED